MEQEFIFILDMKNDSERMQPKSCLKRNENLTSKLVSEYHDQAKTKLRKQCHVDQFGKSQGEYKYWFDNGQVSFIGNLKDGNWHGKCQDWWSNGRRWYIEARHFKKGWHGTKIRFEYGK